MNCELAGICSGCDWIQLDFTEQEKKKTEILHQLAGEQTAQIKLHSPQKWQLRDRVDLTIESQNGNVVIGLMSLDKTHIVDWPTCPMLSPELLKAFLHFRQDLPQITKGSVRLRVGPRAQWGVWLDFSHKDIQSLFEEVNWLQRLSEHFFVEVGQKRKKLEWLDGRPKLNKHSHGNWFSTFIGEREILLESQVASFTQPSLLLNKLMVERVLSLAKATHLSHWVELGAGIGNFSLALSSAGFKVEAIENDPWAIQSLERNKLNSMNLDAQLTQSLNIHRVDFQNQPEKIQALFGDGMGLIVDPPRSGLKDFLTVMAQLSHPPEVVIYISCYPESFKEDQIGLNRLGYVLEVLEGIDQFAQSHHLETVALFKKIK